jgi:hypothetical protein
MTNPDVHPNDLRLPIACGNVPVDLHSEGDEPAVGRSTDSSGKDARCTLLDPSSKFPSGLVRLDGPDPGKLDVLAIREDPDCPGREPAGRPSPIFSLSLREADPATLTAAVSQVGEVLERSREPVQAAALGFLGVLCPPWSNLVLGAVPLLPQRRQRPWHIYCRIGLALVQPSLHQFQSPVVYDSGRSTM